MLDTTIPDHLKSSAPIQVLSVYRVLVDEISASNCFRRKYACGILDKNGNLLKVAHNFAYACKNGCDRIVKGIPHGTRYEECSSVHAEQAALIGSNGHMVDGGIMIIRGLDMETGEEIEALPCKICARMILYSGIKTIITCKNEYNASELCYKIIME